MSKFEMKNIANVASDFKAIYMVVIMLVTGAAWAGDSIWMRKDNVPELVTQIRLENLRDRLAELEIARKWETNKVRINVLESLIISKKSKIQNIIKSK